jgi:nicotinate dehydrogenase subunit A
MIRLLVNGVAREVDADPETPLLYVLRNDLGLMGARFGCGLGLCGACFVHVDGAVVSSCDTPLWSVEGKTVVTVEGLTPHPVQQAFLDEQAAQCGYCVTGIVMSAAALLEREPHPDERRVAEALDRHLCRCGSQQRMVRAIVKAGGDG